MMFLNKYNKFNFTQRNTSKKCFTYDDALEMGIHNENYNNVLKLKNMTIKLWAILDDIEKILYKDKLNVIMKNKPIFEKQKHTLILLDSQIENIYKCVNDAGYDVKEVIFSGIADGSILLDRSQIDHGVVLIDIGSSLTEISLFHGGSLSDFEIIPLGSQDIKGDLKDSPELGNIFAKAGVRIQELSKFCAQAPSVTLTGGLVFDDGMIELAEEKLSCPVKMGVAKGVRGEITSVDSVRLATAIGLIGYACEKYRRKKTEEKNVVKRLSNKVAEIFNNYF